MNRIALVTASILAGLALTAAPAAANNQEWVLGLGLGVYSFSEIDDERQDKPVLGSELDTGALFQGYVEWYALEEIGFGYRVIGIGTGRSGTTATGDKLEQTVGIGLSLFTINWVPIGAESDTRLGVILGIGGAVYEREFTTTDAVTGVKNSVRDTSEGSAVLVGVYLDFGGDGFGGRVGVHSIDTDLDDLSDGSRVDGSGVALYGDIRWAFD